jgi:tartrate dehydratase beta subunit/fumarate hydratase class I family protein
VELSNDKIIELRGKILKGIELAFEKLVKTKQKDDGEFVYSKDGKIYFVKAMDLKECHECK